MNFCYLDKIWRFVSAEVKFDCSVVPKQNWICNIDAWLCVCVCVHSYAGVCACIKCTQAKFALYMHDCVHMLSAYMHVSVCICMYASINILTMCSLSLLFLICRTHSHVRKWTETPHDQLRFQSWISYFHPSWRFVKVLKVVYLQDVEFWQICMHQLTGLEELPHVLYNVQVQLTQFGFRETCIFQQGGSSENSEK